MTTEKKLTRKDIDAMEAAFNAEITSTSKAYRNPKNMNPEAVLAKIEDCEALLMPFITKEVVNGWKIEGWDIQPDADAISVWPITAKIHFRHARLIGYDASLLWAETGSEECFEWLKGAGFPIGEINVHMH